MAAKWAWALAIAGVLAIVLWLLFRPKRDDFVQTLIADAEQRTLPLGSHRTGPVQTERKQLSIQATWEIESDQTWEDYCLAIGEQFRKGGFEETHRSDLKIAFRKTLTGDTLHVVVEIVGTEPLHLRVTFSGYPS